MKKIEVNKKAKQEVFYDWCKENQIVRTTSKELKSMKVRRRTCAQLCLSFYDH